VKLTTLSIAMHYNAWTPTSTPQHAFKKPCVQSGTGLKTL